MAYLYWFMSHRCLPGVTSSNLCGQPFVCSHDIFNLALTLPKAKFLGKMHRKRVDQQIHSHEKLVDSAQLASRASSEGEF